MLLHKKGKMSCKQLNLIISVENLVNKDFTTQFDAVKKQVKFVKTSKLIADV